MIFFLFKFKIIDINVFDEREIIVIGFTEMPTEKEDILDGL